MPSGSSAAIDAAHAATGLRGGTGEARRTLGSTRLDQLGVFDVLLEMLVELSGDTPLLLTVEDLHWADRSSVEFLHHVARNACDAPIAVVATIRTEQDEVSGPLRTPIVEMQRLASVHRRHLTRLSDVELRSLARLITRRHLSEQVIGRLADASGGNPLLATELLRMDVDGWERVTGAVGDIVRAPLDGLPARARATLAVASLTPVAIDTDVLARVRHTRSSTSSTTSVPGWRLAYSSTLTASSASATLLFATAAQRHLLPAQLARAHSAVADVLLDRGDTEPAELAHHLERAGRHSEGLEVSIQAARATAGTFGSIEAVTHYERAFRLWEAMGSSSGSVVGDALGLALEGLECAFYVGDTAAARRCAALALARYGPDDDEDRWITLMCRASELAWQEGETDESLRLLTAAEEALGPASSPGARAHVIERRSFHASMGGDGTAALQLAAAAFELARDQGDLELEIEAQLRVGLAQSMAGAFEDGVATLRDARRRAATVGHHRSVIRATINLTALHVASGDLAVARDEAALGATMAEELEAPLSWQTHAVAWRIVALAGGGHLDEASRLLDQSLSPPAAAFTAVLDIAGAELAWTAGDLTEARYLIERVSLQPQDHLGWWLRSELVRRSVLLADGDLATAAADVDFVLDLAEFWPDGLLVRLCTVAMDATASSDRERLDVLLARGQARADQHRQQGRPIDTEAWWHLLRARHAAQAREPSGHYYLDAARAFERCGRPRERGLGARRGVPSRGGRPDQHRRRGTARRSDAPSTQRPRRSGRQARRRQRRRRSRSLGSRSGHHVRRVPSRPRTVPAPTPGSAGCSRATGPRTHHLPRQPPPRAVEQGAAARRDLGRPLRLGVGADDTHQDRPPSAR